MTKIPFCTLSENSFVSKFSWNSEIRTGSRPSHHFGTGSSNKYQASLEKSKGMMGLGVIVLRILLWNTCFSKGQDNRDLGSALDETLM